MSTMLCPFSCFFSLPLPLPCSPPLDLLLPSISEALPQELLLLLLKRQDRQKGKRNANSKKCF